MVYNSKHVISLIVCLQIVSLGQNGYTKDKPDMVRVAVVSYTEEYNDDVKNKLNLIIKDLSNQNRIHLQDEKTTQDILKYYLQYVDQNARGTEANELLKQARESYLKKDFNKSQELLKEAEKNIKESIKDGNGNELLVELYILKAKVEYRAGNKGLIKNIYREIVRLYPDLEFPNSLYSNWERNVLKDSKKEIAKELTANIDVYSDPINSEVYLNGVRRGVTYYDKPFIINSIAAGRHCIEVKSVNYEPFTQYVDTSSNKNVEIRAKLKRITAKKDIQDAVVQPSHFNTPYELSNLISSLGYYLKVDKVVLVHQQQSDRPDILTYQIGDTNLGALGKPLQIDSKAINKTEQILAIKEMINQMKKDVLSNPDQLTSKSVGSMYLMEKRKQPLYKKPLFWVLMGAGAATGGVVSALVGVSGAATAATGGMIISF